MKRVLVGIAVSLICYGVGTFAQGSPSLGDVMKAPAKFVGQKACWFGQINSAHEVQTGGGRFEKVQSNWMAVDDKGNTVRELVFVVDEKSAKITPAATLAARTQGDRGQRLVCGVIAGTKVADLNIGGKSVKVTAPALSDATIDIRPSKVD